MQEDSAVRFFPGANTADGFYSLYEDLADERAGDFVFYVKGGPGNGKSTFMRKIARAAEERGLEAEYALCSGDPASLDGIYIPALKTAFVDATAPHVQEPALPGASGRYIDLSVFYKKNARWETERIDELFRLYREEYGGAYDLFSAARLCRPGSIPLLVGEAEKENAKKQAEAFLSRSLKPGGGAGEKRRFLTALTCEGRIVLWESVRRMEKVCILEDTCGLADAFLQSVRETCRKNGCGVILCPDPLSPGELWGVLIPGAGIAICTSEKEDSYPGKIWRRFRLDGIVGAEKLRRNREEIRRRGAYSSALVRCGMEHLRRAKDYHDRLEAEYSACVDFSALDRFTIKTVKNLFAER